MCCLLRVVPALLTSTWVGMDLENSHVDTMDTTRGPFQYPIQISCLVIPSRIPPFLAYFIAFSFEALLYKLFVQ